MNRQTGARRGREWAIQPNVQIVHSSDSFLISFICFSLSFTARHLPLTPRLGEGILLIWQGRRPFDEDETTFLFFPSKWTWRHNGGGWRRMWRDVGGGRILHFWQVVGSLSIAFLWLHHWRKLDTCRLSKALSMIRIVRSDDTGWSFRLPNYWTRSLISYRDPNSRNMKRESEGEKDLANDVVARA